MRLVLVAALLLSTAPAFALDAVSYKATLGGKNIVVELTDPAGSTVFGRYSYLDHGGDIPLDAVETSEGVITLAEEAPCTEKTCVANADYEVTEAPIAAHWQLRLKADGTITGGWNPVAKGEALDIELTEIGRRTVADDMVATPSDLADSAWSKRYDDPANFVAAVDDPYDTAKMNVALDEGPVETIEGSTYRLVTDPRSKFAFPRVVAFADGSSTDAANAALDQRHAEINMNAFSCLSTAYAGMGYRPEMGGGGLGDYDAESITMQYLSPTIVGWRETGSTYCGGAHPNNHDDSYVIDAKTGKPFFMGYVLKDWVAQNDVVNYDAVSDQQAALANPDGYDWAPGQALIAYALAHKGVVNDDPDYDSECPVDDFVNQGNLGFSFAPGDELVISIAGLAYAEFACSGELLRVKLSDIPDLLAPTAKDYFPSLAN